VTRTLGLTVYGCEQDEADLFHELSPCYGVAPTMTRDAVSVTSAMSLPGNRCISVGHKSELSGRELRALKEAGVEHVSTRSIGLNHIDLHAAAHLGITVENAAYAPDGVADYTVMLILMAIRNAKETLRSAHKGDFRLRSVRGKELRDLTVGVVGVGNIGKAVIRRLHGFECRVLASNDRFQETAAEWGWRGVVGSEGGGVRDAMSRRAVPHPRARPTPRHPTFPLPAPRSARWYPPAPRARC
jgi:D-specific alpha-keto acid dehydrogenase